MKRTFAAVLLLAALGVLLRPAARPTEKRAAPGPITPVVEPDPEAEVRARYTETDDRALVEGTLARFGRHAVAIERTDGLSGLALVDRLDVEAVYLYERHPEEFRRLSALAADRAAADLLLQWRDYFRMKRTSDTDRGLLVAELARLTPAQRRTAARYPSALPLILAEPAGVADLIERAADTPHALADALAILSFISLEPGATDLRAALRAFDARGPIALDAFRGQGIDGFALVLLYGPVLDALGAAMPLEEALVLLRVNAEYVDEQLRAHDPKTVAQHLRHVAAKGLTEAVGGSERALRLVVEYGARGERALAVAGAGAAEVVYGDFADATLRSQAVDALAEHGPMALAVLDTYATDPDFRDVLRTWGAAAIPPIARAETGPDTLAALRAQPQRTFTESLALARRLLARDNGQATIGLIRKEGLDRVSSLDAPGEAFSEWLPLYDVLHLGNTLRRGPTPTTGAAPGAIADSALVVADALNLRAIPPESAQDERNAAKREAVALAGQALSEDEVENATRDLTKWWAVRNAGGTYHLLRRLPEALAHLTLPESAQLAGPLAGRAGLHLSAWKPLHFVRDGQEARVRVPTERGLEFVAAQSVQAGAGVIAYQKMEEHLASRRPASR